MYSAQQLVYLACQICNAPGRSVSAGQMLNLILADYAQTLDLDTIRLDGTLSIGPQATIPYFYTLPVNYLRMADEDITYNVSGEVFNPVQFSLRELDTAYTVSGISNYPTNWATDVSKSPTKIAFYPPPSVPITINYRYRPSSLDITNPETSAGIPFFPNQLILLKELCVQVGDIAGGADRSQRWEAEIKRRMEKYLMMDDDKEGYSAQVQLDRRYFRTSNKLPPSKVLGF